MIYSKIRPLSNSKLVVLIVISAVCLGLAFILFWSSKFEDIEQTSLQARVPASSLNSKYYDLTDMDTSEFTSYLKGLTQNPEQLKYPVSGIVVPHHLLAGSLIARILQQTSFQNPRTVLLIGPNHYEAGTFGLITSNAGWKTPFGQVLPNQTWIELLTQRGDVYTNNDVMLKEHAISGLIPFISYFFPFASHTPVIVSSFTPLQDIDLLSSVIAQNLDQNTILILSLDFSHYLNSEQATDRDSVSLQAITGFDYEKIARFTNEYVDSPKSLRLFLKVMQQRGKTNITVIDHTNSGNITGNIHSENTSYYTLTFH